MSIATILKKFAKRHRVVLGATVLVIVSFAAPAAPAHAIYVQYFSASPSSVSYGQGTVLRAHCQDQDGIMIYDYPVYSGYPYGNVYAGGSEDVTIFTPPLYATKEYWLACGDNRITNTVYAYGYLNVPVTPPTPTTINSFYASPSVVPINTATTLYYSATQGQSGTGLRLYNVTDAINYGLVSGFSGNWNTGNLSHATTYNLYPEDSYYGETTPTQITVTAAATVTADATAPTTIGAGQSATITFYADSATPPTQCQINNYNDTVALYNVAGCSTAQARSYNTGVLNTPGVYSYKFYYYLGAWNFVKTVTITVVPSCTLTASPNPVVSGNTTTLSYTSTSATSGSIDNGVEPLATTSGASKKIFITAGSSWTVPSDWNNANNTIEVIGGGGGGAAGQAAPVYSGGGGGGGAYAKHSNVVLTPGAAVTYQVGTAGAVSTAGGDTYFCNINSNCGSISGTAVVAGAKGGGGASTHSGGASGSSTLSIGDTGTVFAGGKGGSGWAAGGGGGGGAAGPSGAGGKGGSMVASAYGGGGGGGGNGGANAANTAANNNGTAGGHNAAGTGGGAGGTANVAGSPGSSGGGGGGGGGNSGASGAPGGAGGAGTTWTATNVWNGSAYTGATPTSGPGGGGGGGGGAGPGAAANGASGASYGAGGGGGGTGTSNGAGASGAQGIVVITYAPAILVSPNTKVTPPVVISPTTYTMTVTDSASGLSGTCSAPVTITDICTDISGFQSAAPSAPCVTPAPSPGQCVPSGYTYNGSACVLSSAAISNFSGPTRVRKGATAVLTYTVTDPPASCTITGNNGFATTVTPSNGVQGSVTSTPIEANTRFTLTCGAVSQSISIGITPTVKEQ